MPRSEWETDEDGNTIAEHLTPVVIRREPAHATTGVGPAHTRDVRGTVRNAMLLGQRRLTLIFDDDRVYTLTAPEGATLTHGSIHRLERRTITGMSHGGLRRQSDGQSWTRSLRIYLSDRTSMRLTLSAPTIRLGAITITLRVAIERVR